MTTVCSIGRPSASHTQCARLAYVYVRQSSPGQVVHHGESTDLQYRLVERAISLGWPRDLVQVIDEDLGRSGMSADQRTGFQRLIAEISLARVGIVLSLDASRLARNSSDWYRLIELCGLFGTLIADGERLYDPSDYHDRLLLGLSGMMSEAELHQLKLRLHAGALNKAARGELRVPLPAGFVRRADGTVGFDPDAEVQARLRLVFAKFAVLGSARAVMRWLRREGLSLPARPHHGPEPFPVIWQEARTSRVLGILKTPAYAGAYVYGRRGIEATRRAPGQPHSGAVRRPLEAWPICLQGIYPAYIPWEEFVHNQQRLQDNQSCYRQAHPGVARDGHALLAGIARCGRCGGRLSVAYEGTAGEYPVYRCADARTESGAPLCQEIRAAGVDALVEEVLLAALAPDRLAVALAAVEALEQEERVLEQQWKLRIERARYEAQRAERQYQLVEPENRLVARTLESQWELALRKVAEIEHQAEVWRRRRAVPSSAADRQAIVDLGQNLPQLWHAATTTPAERKRMLRLVIREVVLDGKRARGLVWLQITWQTGATTEHWLQRRVLGYDEYADLERLEQRVRALHAAGHVDAQIAATLNGDGFQSAHGRPFNGRAIWYLRRRWNLPAVRPVEPAVTASESVSTAEEAAALIGVGVTTIYKWLSNGRLRGEQVHGGLPWRVVLSPDKIEQLRSHAAHARRVRRSNEEAAR